MSSTLGAGQASPPSEQPPRSAPPGVPLATVISFLLGGLVFLAIAVVALVVINKDDSPGSANAYHATPMPVGMPRPDFTLTDQHGEPYDFGTETQGQLTLVFFGYTHCPDVCPLTMDFISQALDQVDVAAKVVFITTDPARDTPERLTQWLGGIDKDFIGLTGTRDEVIAAQQALDVTVAVPEDPDPKGNYAVGHSSQVFVFTQDDQAHLLYGFGTRLGDWVEDLPKIAANKDWQGTAP